MYANSPILTLHQSCEEAVNWMIEKIRLKGLSVMRTFDLQVAMHAKLTCPCKYYGTDLCECQMVVMLVYASNTEPVTMIAHGSNDQTSFSLVDTPQQRVNPKVEAAIRHIVNLSIQPND